MRVDLIARDAATSVRRACPLCPEDMPELGPGEIPLVGPIECTDPEPLSAYNGWVVEYPSPQVVSWGLSCGHRVSADAWCWISAPLGDSCGDRDPVYFWWVPRAVYDEALKD